MPDAPLSYWIGFHVLLFLLFLAEFVILRRKQTPSRAVVATCLWIAAALAFTAFILRFFDRQHGVEFISGYAIEESLSVDNLFVFLLLFREFTIREKCQRPVLFWGILGAVVMRGSFIAAGIELLRHFEWVTYIFGGLLLVAAIRLLLPQKEDATPGKPGWVKWVEKLVPVSHDQENFFVRENGKLHITVLTMALIAIAFTDFVFALDSIPAVLSITRHPFIAYTSNVMAVMGLRSLYFLLAHLLEKLQYLHFGLAAVLAFAAFKMLAAQWVEISALLSLGIIIGMLAVTIVASILFQKK